MRGSDICERLGIRATEHEREGAGVQLVHAVLSSQHQAFCRQWTAGRAGTGTCARRWLPAVLCTSVPRVRLLGRWCTGREMESGNAGCNATVSGSVNSAANQGSQMPSA